MSSVAVPGRVLRSLLQLSETCYIFVVGGMKSASCEANLGGVGTTSLFHSSFLSSSLWEESRRE